MQHKAKPEATERGEEQAVNEHDSTKPTELIRESAANGSRSDVLIVSTRPEHLKTLMRVLAASSGRVVVASSSRLAKDALSRQSFGIVFCDESLSDGSYRDLLSAHDKSSDLKLVLLLPLGDWPEYLEAMQLGAFEVLRSPLQPVEVENVLLRATINPAAPRKSSPRAKIVAATLIL
jgi:DNA-binding NtrC family response regulator